MSKNTTISKELKYLQVNMNNLQNLVKIMKNKNKHSFENEIIEKIQNSKNLEEKCILIRFYLFPQSTKIEKIIINDLLLNKPNDEVSGDCCKNGKNYEIKYTGHSKESKINIVQIRPDHKIDYYLIIYYNMFFNDNIGKAYIFKITSEEMNNLILKYGSYAHGTIKKLGKITKDNLQDRNCEYCLRCNPNNKSNRNQNLWNEFLKYQIRYISEDI